jgi:hypothetical protein
METVPAPVEATSVVPAGADDALPRTESVSHHPLASRINAGATLEEDLQVVAALLRDMNAVLKHYPSRPLGSNRDFTAALSGKNHAALAALPPDHPAINAQGELVDRYGSPLHFHPLTLNAVEIRSAGPDRKLFTSDDAVHAAMSDDQRKLLLQGFRLPPD